MNFSYLHPTAKAVLGAHDQTNWSITKDGLICAPVGFYRILKQYDPKQGDEAAITIGFAFKPEELDLIPHPKDPTQKILKNPPYIAPPQKRPSCHFGCAQELMFGHQGNWLEYELACGNLYYTDRTKENKGEYFSNMKFSFGIFPEIDPKTKKQKGYRVTYRADPFNEDSKFGLDQDNHGFSPRLIFNKGINLKSFRRRNEALRFIHAIFDQRSELFPDGFEIQRWEDPNLVLNVAMWLTNRLRHLYSEPSSVTSNTLKLLEFASKPSVAPALIGVATDTEEKKAEREKNPVDIENIAEIDEHRPHNGPLNRMKNEVREDWITVDNPGPPLFYNKLPICDDLEAHQRVHAIDIINGRTSVMVTQYNDSSAPSVITARTRLGIQVHHTDSSTRYVTYAPPRGGKIDALPAKYAQLFSEAGIACVKRCAVSDPLPEGAQIFHHLPYDPEHHLIYSFKTAAQIIAELPGQPHMARVVKRHRMPLFESAQPVKPARTPREKQLSGFQRCAKNLTYYGAVLVPTTKLALNDLLRSYASFAACAIVATNKFPQLLENGMWLLFAIGSGLMTQRLTERARTLQGKNNLLALTRGIFAAGFLSYSVKSSIEIYHDFTEHKRQEDKGDLLENALAAGIAGWLTSVSGKSALASVNKAINLRNTRPEPIALRRPTRKKRRLGKPWHKKILEYI